jgi:hypothetical protein
MKTVNQAPVPAWIRGFMDEIDTLEFGPAFEAVFTEDSEMNFGNAHVRGAEAIKAFFIKIDTPLATTHRILETWSGDGVLFLRGEATIAKKTEPDSAVRAPFMHVYHLEPGETCRIRTLHITAGPLETDTLL